MLAKEKVLAAGIISSLLLIFFHDPWLTAPFSAVVMYLIFVWLFAMILCSAYMVVRHAEALAKLLQEPAGTIILTLSVIIIEIVMIASVMLTGQDEPTLARDTMFSVIMIVLNGIVGVSLLLGGWRHREQYFNLQGCSAFLSVILMIAVIGLIVPTYTHSTPDPTLSTFLSIFLIIASIGIYTVFLFMQTGRHRLYFADSNEPSNVHSHHAHRKVTYSLRLHIFFLLSYLLITIFLAKNIAVPIDFILSGKAENSSIGGVIVAILILFPEALSAVRAALANQMQRSINISLGSVLATIGLTIPAVLILGFIIGKPIILGLDPLDSIMLMLTLLVSILTFATGRTNILQGMLHLLLFAAFIALIFD